MITVLRVLFKVTQSDFRTHALDPALNVPRPRHGGALAAGRPRSSLRSAPPLSAAFGSTPARGPGECPAPSPAGGRQEALPLPRKARRPPRACQTARQRAQARRGPERRTGSRRCPPPGPALLSPQAGRPPRPTPRAARPPRALRDAARAGLPAPPHPTPRRHAAPGRTAPPVPRSGLPRARSAGGWRRRCWPWPTGAPGRRAP